MSEKKERNDAIVCIHIQGTERETRLQRLQLTSRGEIRVGNGLRESRLWQRAIRDEWGDRNGLTVAVMGVSGQEVKLLELGSKESELYCM